MKRGIASRLEALERSAGVGISSLIVSLRCFADAPLSAYIVNGTRIARQPSETEEALLARAVASLHQGGDLFVAREERNSSVGVARATGA